MAGIAETCDRLTQHYGDLGWWPAETRFEILVGAVLVQNTTWVNVVSAIGQLGNAIDPVALLDLPETELAALIRSAGYFNVKARRLRNLCRWFVDAGGFETLDRTSTEVLRGMLLEVNGIGPETCDDILLYAFNRPVFIIDAYTRRVFGRLGLIDQSAAYEDLRQRFELGLAADVARMQHAHAVVVEHGKSVCRTRPRCHKCLLQDSCALFLHDDN